MWGDFYNLDDRAAAEAGPGGKASLIYSNAGNLIIPIVTSVLGPEWVIYTSGFISVQVILIWTHCKMLLCGEKKADLKKS